MSNYAKDKREFDRYMGYLRENNESGMTDTEYCARIERGTLYYEDNAECSIDDPQFQEFIDCDWVIVVKSLDAEIDVTTLHGSGIKTFKALDMHMTLRAEVRGLSKHWSAYRKQNGILRKVYLGQSDRVTKDALIQAALRMSGYKNAKGDWL